MPDAVVGFERNPRGRNDLQMKLTDGDNVWWKVWRNYRPSAEWREIASDLKSAGAVETVRVRDDAPLVSLAQALVRQRSLESGVAFDLIANQSELAALVSALRRGNDTALIR